MNDLIQKLKYKYENGEINVKLIFICTAIYFLSVIINFMFFGKSVYKIDDYFTASAGFHYFIQRPWGILTYPFFHGSLMHLAFNMLMLYFVGKMFLSYFRTYDLLTFLIFGAISGAVFFMIYSEYANQTGRLSGASAAIYAVLFALYSYMPKKSIQLFPLNFQLRIEQIAWVLLIYDFLMIMSGSNIGGHISHLGGAAFGFFYMKQFEKGNDFLGKIFKSVVSKPQIKKTTKKSQTPPRDNYEFNARKMSKQKEIDKILDKISRSGYDSLTKEEKDTLFNAGKNG